MGRGIGDINRKRKPRTFELGGSDDLWDCDCNNLDFNEDLSDIFDHAVGFIAY